MRLSNLLRTLKHQNMGGPSTQELHNTCGLRSTIVPGNGEGEMDSRRTRTLKGLPLLTQCVARVNHLARSTHEVLVDTTPHASSLAVEEVCHCLVQSYCSSQLKFYTELPPSLVGSMSTYRGSSRVGR